MSFYSQTELEKLGFAGLGRNVKLSRLASIHNPSSIFLGDFVRIDDFCVISAGEGGIDIGRNVHIAVSSVVMGAGPIKICEFAGLSSRVTIYSSNDDYSGEWMTNPTLPMKYTRVCSAPVRIGRHVIVGAGSIVLPGVSMGDGSGTGAFSLIKADCDSLGMYAGCPAKKIGARSNRIFELESAYLKEILNHQ